MKLIRLTTENNDGSFECNFNTDINIKENSKVALKSASFTTQNVVFRIDADNDVFNWNFTNATINFDVSVILDHAEYNDTNINVFLLDLQTKLNNGLRITGVNLNAKMIGLQWKVESKKGFLEIGYLSSYYSMNHQEATLTNIDRSAVNDTLTKTTAQSVDDTARIFWNKPFIKGAGVHQVSIASMVSTGTTGTGFFIGITRTKLDDIDPTNITPLHKDTYIYVEGNENGGGGGFSMFYGNLDANGANPTTPTATGTLHTGGADTLDISLEGGKISLGLYTGGGAGTYTQFYQMDYDGTTDFYPYIIMRSDNTKLSLAQGRTQLDPYLLTSSNDLNNNDLGTTLGDAPSGQPKTRGTNTLSFDLDIEKMLGFTDEFDLTDEGEDALFKASSIYDFGMFNDTYLVLLDNLRLDSYDGFTKEEKSILGCINVSDNNTNRVVQYESNTLDYIELKNKKEISIRNIRGRIVKSDLGSVILNGLTSLVILIE